MKMYVPTWTRGMAFTALLVTLTAATATAQDTISVSSPDGRNKAGVATHQGRLYYILSRDGRSVMMPSLLGVRLLPRKMYLDQ